MAFSIKRDNRVFGPYAIEKLRELAASGRLLPTDQLSQDGGSNWFMAKSVRGLLPAEPPPKPQVALPPKPRTAPPPKPRSVTERKFLIARGMSVYGPYTVAQIKDCVRDGSIVATDKISFEGGTEWTDVTNVPGLFGPPKPTHAIAPPVPTQIAPLPAQQFYSQPYAPPHYQTPVQQQAAGGSAIGNALDLGLKAMALYWMYESADTTDAIGDWYREND